MLDLFSGIGGFSLAAEWVWGDELEIVGFCENEPYPQKVLKKNFPGVPIYKDIKELDGEAFKDIDLITGGFPCQDISIAGRGAGIEGARSGLWSEMHRLISHIRPRYVIIENVPMLTVRGGTRVISDLAEIGMDAEWQIVGADDVGAWHRRKRIWIVAYPDSGLRGRRRAIRESREDQEGQLRSQKKGKVSYDVRSEAVRRSTLRGETGNIPDSDNSGSGTSRYETDKDRQKENKGREEFTQSEPSRHSTKVSDSDSTGRRERRRSESVQETFHSSECDSQRFPADYWLSEPDVGRVANGIPSKVDRLKGLGNAIVPQCAIVIMELIKQADAKPQ